MPRRRDFFAFACLLGNAVGVRMYGIMYSWVRLVRIGDPCEWGTSWAGELIRSSCRAAGVPGQYSM